jgi:homopolymeric O-antigen transport system permease protein
MGFLHTEHTSFADEARQAGRDAACSLAQWPLWIKLGIRDVFVQYERAVIGPFWLTLQAAAWIGAIVFVFSGLLDESGRDYAAYVAVGLVLFNFITTIVTNGSEVFIQNRIVIHSHPSPYFAYVLRLVVSALFQLALQSIAIIITFLLIGEQLNAQAWLAIPGLVLGILMCVSLALTFGLAGVRFGDFRFAMLAVMRLMLFVSPIMWRPENGGALKKIAANINPISYYIEIVRGPILGHPPALWVYGAALAWFVAFSLIALVWFILSRRTISMWV